MSILIFLDLDDVICLNTAFSGWDVISIYSHRRTIHGKPSTSSDPDWQIVHLDAGHQIWKDIFFQEGCKNLRALHDEFHNEADIKYVISSSWRMYLQLNEFRDLFVKVDLDFVAYNIFMPTWRTPDLGSTLLDVTIWLSQNTNDRHSLLILDDLQSGSSLVGSSFEHDRQTVLCRSEVGFVKTKYEEARQCLRAQLRNE